MVRHGSIICAKASVIGMVGQLESPFFDHFKAFGVPNVSFQPEFVSLSPVVLQEQVAGSSTILSGRSFGLWRETRFGHLAYVAASQFSRHAFGVVRHDSATHVNGELLEYQLGLLWIFCKEWKQCLAFIVIECSNLLEL